MARITKALIFVKFLLCFVCTGYGLSCLACISTDINGKCRHGGRNRKQRVQTCYGHDARCYSTIMVSQNISAIIARGCSKHGSCNDGNKNVKYCSTCNFKHCNFNHMGFGETDNFSLESTTNELSAYININREPRKRINCLTEYTESITNIKNRKEGSGENEEINTKINTFYRMKTVPENRNRGRVENGLKACKENIQNENLNPHKYRGEDLEDIRHLWKTWLRMKQRRGRVSII